MNPKRFLSVKSAVPGCANSDSAAPPTTIVILDPGPTHHNHRASAHIISSHEAKRREFMQRRERGMKRTFLQDIRARPLAHGPDAEQEEDVPVERDVEVVR